MSIRTLIEFNHDYIRQLEDDPEQVAADILQILREGSFNPLMRPHSNLLKLKGSRHHSDPCPIDGQ